MLLVDEIDRADDEFEAFLLEMLADAAITIPELGRIAATTPPLTVLTSNRTREVHDALKRRCLYHWVEHPGFEREVQILRTAAARLDRAAGRRGGHGGRPDAVDWILLKPPGVAESLDWAAALAVLGARTLDPDRRPRARSASVLKYREDADRVRASGPRRADGRVDGPRRDRRSRRIRAHAAGRPASTLRRTGSPSMLTAVDALWT